MEPLPDARAVRLLGLILVDALDSIAKGRRDARVREARAWVCASANAPYSFEHACEAFGLPPRMLRRRLGLRATSPRRSERGWVRLPRR